MNKKGVLVLSFLFGVLLLIVGCAQQKAEETTTNPTLTSSVSIRGSLKAGAIRSAGAAAAPLAYSSLSGYKVVAVGTADNKVYFAGATDSNGDFTISSLPSGESFMLEIIDNNNKFIAPVSFGKSNGEVVMAITPEAGGGSINLGEIFYQSSKATAVPTLEISSSNLDGGATARLKSGEDFVPVGAGILGRGTGEAAYSGSLLAQIDEDKDGLPDVIDIDDDGDGKVDGLDNEPRGEGRHEVEIPGITNVGMFSNLVLSYQNFPTYINGTLNTAPIDVATQTIVTIFVSMAPGVNPNTFSDIRVVEGPAWLEKAAISMADPSVYAGYPSGGTLWKDDSYKLYRGPSSWQVWIYPNATPEAGDVLKFKLINSATTEYLIATLTYLFYDIPRLVSYSDSDGTKEGSALDLSVYNAGTGEVGQVFGYKGSTLTLRWITPKDDLGNRLAGLNYNLGAIEYYDANQATLINAGALQLASSEITTISDATFGLVYQYTFTPTTESFSHFKLDLDAISPAANGGHASQLIRFKKL